MTGRLSRREVIAAGGAAAVGIATLGVAGCGGDDEVATTTSGASTEPSGATGASTVDCVLTPEQTEGPYYVDDAIVRRDVREDRDGTELELGLTIRKVGDCDPIPDATVEIWHADADGVYSAFGEGEGQTFLRGAQRTDGNGIARFMTIYPGWYPGRTVHIHVKVHVEGDAVHTGQLYFDDETTDEVYEDALYAGRGERDVRNDADGIYAAGGDASLLSVKPTREGYTGTISMGVAT